MIDAVVMPRGRGLLPPKALLLSLLVQLPLLAWSFPLAPTLLELSGGSLLAAIGAGLNIWADLVFRRHGVGVCPFSPVADLVAEGPFRFSRNPMYLGLVLVAAGVAVLSGVPGNLWAAAAYALWLHYRFVLPEEAFLRSQLGEAYRRYASMTPRWLLVGPARA